MAVDKDKIIKALKVSAVVLGTAFVGLEIAAKKKKPDSIYADEPEEKNPMEGRKVHFVEDDSDSENADGVRGHLVSDGKERHTAGVYEKYIKRGLDVALSFGGLVVLSPVLGAIALAIKIDDPGPALFVQKRVGENKQYFKLHKFRSMKMSTPHDVPTHMLEDPDQYITKVGRFIRAHSLDELPQIWDIFLGNMSVIGPRPALWNQDLLTAERDKYGANDVKPGLTGWAQINGRDELEIPDKARLDGEYVSKLNSSALDGLKMDAKCFAGSIHVFNGDDTVVEGGTGAISDSKGLRHGVPEIDPEENFASDYSFTVDKNAHKKVLVVGAGSYIGDSFVRYAKQKYPENFTIKVVGTRPDKSYSEISSEECNKINEDSRDITFRTSELERLTDGELGSFDIVYHLAGIAHADVGHVSEETKEQYYEVNTDLAIRTAERYKAALIKAGRKGCFVFMSSMIVYGESAPFGQNRVITKSTVPAPANFYGDSKWQADKGIRALADDDFCVAVLRPPMIYGKGSKGNYPKLAKLAKKLPVFPDVENSRSMLYIGNLCEFLCELFLSDLDKDKPDALIFMPQNSTYTKTSDMVAAIAKATGHRIHLQKVLNPAVSLADHVPGKIKGLVDKAFGNNCYEQEISRYKGIEYQKYSLNCSIIMTERNSKQHKQASKGKCNSKNRHSSIEKDNDKDSNVATNNDKKKVLIVTSVASMIDQFIKPNIELLKSMGFAIDVATNFREPGNITIERSNELLAWLADNDVDSYQIDFDRNAFDMKADKTALNQMEAVFKGTATPIKAINEDKCISTVKRHTNEPYFFMHCHSPIGGVVGRITAHKYHVKSIYTAHGFHFYKGAPLKNWMLFYPVEKLCSYWTDVLITINKEDYALAQKKMKAKEVVYVPGVGIDTKKFSREKYTKEEITELRKSLGVSDNEKMFLSVGELSERKNHKVVIKALSNLGRKDFKYFIAGEGQLKDELSSLIKELNLEGHVELLGYRDDISKLCDASDLFIFPSKQEGLPVALMEAIASRTPVICSSIRGNIELVQENQLFKFASVEQVKNRIIEFYENGYSKETDYNYLRLKHFDINVVNKQMRKIYEEFTIK